MNGLTRQGYQINRVDQVQALLSQATFILGEEMKYDKLSDSLKSPDRKAITPKSSPQEILEGAAEYIIGIISQGDSLDKLPVNSKVIPALADIYAHIGKDQKLNEKLIKAEQNRCLIVKERMISVMNEYTKNPSPENRDVFQAAHKAFESLSKSAPSQDAVVNIEYYNNFPEDFWSNLNKDK